MKVSRDTIRHWEAIRQSARLAREFDPLDQSAKVRELRAWLMVHWIPAQNQPELLDDDAMQAWMKQADANDGMVYIGRIWSVTGLPQSFSVRGDA